MGMGALLLSIALNKQLLLFSEMAQCLFIFQSFHKLPVSSRLLMQLKLCLLTLSNLIWFAFICNTSFVTLNHVWIFCSTILSLLTQGYTGKNEYIAAQGEGFSSIQLLLLPQSRRKFEHKQWIEWSLYLKYYWLCLYSTPAPCCRWSVDLSSRCLFVKIQPTLFYIYW